MSNTNPKINQIQNAILELEGGAFQKLMDCYLFKEGYSRINSIGSSIGNNKTRIGTPDTLISLENRKYVFVEYTTQKTKILKKFSDDIEKCLDESKTGITTDKIEKIILCYTSQLSPEKIEKLRQKCQIVNVELEVYGIHAIAHALCNNYPSIARDYLGIEVDTGQIIALDDFISLYGNRLATTLETSFHFREFEKDRLLKSLLENNLVVISGQAGVGKTRLAIEGFRNFIAINSSYKAYCIFNKDANLFEDIQCYFAEAGDYLIFVDDANRISGFQYLTQLFQTKRADQNFKILVTVRDYALEKVKKIYDDFEADVINLSSLEDNEIEELIEDESNITDYFYLEKIVNISCGNPRLAMMAATVAKKDHTFEFRDVTELYDKYYSSIKDDLDNLNNKNVLKLIGVISFFRSIDQANIELMTLIKSLVNISTEDFREISRQLHELELVDLFENDVVKISDQVLATYVIYLVFFKEKILDFSVLLSKQFFPKFRQRLIDAIDPILSHFDFKNIKNSMSPAVNSAYNWAQQNDSDMSFQLLDVFWFLKSTEILLLSKKAVDEVSEELIDINDIKFEIKPNSQLPSCLSLLPRLQQIGIDETKMSVQLILEYAEKRPKYIPAILCCLTMEYGFKLDSIGYYTQLAVVNEVISRCYAGKNEFFANIFIVLAESYLYTHFYEYKATRNNNGVNLIEFDLIKSKELTELRGLIWNNLFYFYKNQKLQKSISLFLSRHSQPSLETFVDSIIEEDSILVLNFFQDSFSPSSLWHCILVQEYLRFLDGLDISYSNFENLSRFNSEHYKYYEMLTKRHKSETCRENLKKDISVLFNTFTIEHYSNLLEDFSGITQYFIETDDKWRIQQGVSLVLEELSERNSLLYRDVLENTLQTDLCLNFNTQLYVDRLIKSCGAATVFKLIQTLKSPQKYSWLTSYYCELPKEDIKHEDLNGLIMLYTTAEYKHLTNLDTDYLLKYESLDKGFIVRIMRIMLNRMEKEPSFAELLSPVFDKDTEVNNYVVSLLSEHGELIEDTYIKVDSSSQYIDYDGTTFSKLIDNNALFIDKYLENQFVINPSWIKDYNNSRDYSFIWPRVVINPSLIKIKNHNNSHDYSFIWQRDDYNNVMKKISTSLFEYGKQRKQYFDLDYYVGFFKKSVHPQTDEKIIARQNNFLNEEITLAVDNFDYMYFLFSVITTFEFERQLQFYQHVLQLNWDIELFKSLCKPVLTSKSWSGSKVPLLQQEKSFYESLLPSCNSIDLLEHRQFIENQIEQINQEIQIEKKIDFTEYY